MSHTNSGSASLPKAPQEGNNDSVVPTPNEILLRHYVSRPPPPGAMVRLRLGSAERRRPRPPHSPNTKSTTTTTHDHDQHRPQQLQQQPASPLSTTTPAPPRAAVAGSFATAAIREMPPLSPQRPTTAPSASVLAAASPRAARPSTAGSPQGPVPVGRPSTAVSSRWSVASTVEASPSLPAGDRPSTARNSRHHSAPRARDTTPTQLVSPGRQLCLSPRVHSARERRTVPPALLQKVHSMVVAPPPAPTRLQVDLQPFLAEDFSSLMATAPEAPPYHSVKSPQLHDSILAWNRSAMTLLRLP